MKSIYIWWKTRRVVALFRPHLPSWRYWFPGRASKIPLIRKMFPFRTQESAWTAIVSGIRKRTSAHMARLSAILLASVAVSAPAQSIAEKTPVELNFEHDTRYAVNLFTNGVLFQSFTLAEVVPVFTNSTATAITFRIISKPIPAPGTIAFSATVLAADATESDPSNTNVVKVKPLAPQNLTAGKGK